jgi:hypothetical protein
VEFNFLKLVFTLSLGADTADRYLLFGMRTDFAESFRRTVGCERTGCAGCPRISSCPYHQIFSQAISPDPSAVKRFQKPPLPFVFDMPLLAPIPNGGSTVEVGLTLAGPAVNHVTYFLGAVGLLFRHWESVGKMMATVDKVESVDYAGNRAVVAEHGRAAFLDRLSSLSLDGLLKSTVLSPDTVGISISTPLCLIQNGRLLRQLSFPALVRNLFRRMSAIAYYYGGLEMELDYKWLSRNSTQITACIDEFRWVEWSKSLYGVVGSGTFAGDLIDFLPFLLFGEHFHAGKGAAYGLGCYRLENAG